MLKLNLKLDLGSHPTFSWIITFNIILAGKEQWHVSNLPDHMGFAHVWQGGNWQAIQMAMWYSVEETESIHPSICLSHCWDFKESNSILMNTKINSKVLILINTKVF